MFRRVWIPSIALLFAAAASAQETINYASISGRVTDGTGGVVQGAVVTARQLDTNWKTQAVTDREGRFRFPYLNVGLYEVKIQRPGFADALRSVRLSVGTAFELPVSLTVAAAETNVMVTSDATLLETTRSQIASAVSKTEVTSLPLAPPSTGRAVSRCGSP